MNKKTNQNHFIKAKLVFIPVLLLLFLLVYTQAYAQSIDIRVHDPTMIKADSTYYIFCTGPGITVYSSTNMRHWQKEPSVFDKAPDWANKIVPGFDHAIWAPDINYYNGKYYLYYSVSSFGKNTSAIGVATNVTLDADDRDYHWKDQGIVIRSIPGRDLWNAIDPQLFIDQSDTPWMVFGSFWHGIKLVKMDTSLTEIARPQEWYTLASRARSWKTPDRKGGNGAVEAPFIFYKNGYYYLFVSYDYCCRGVKSNYKIMVGRSRKVTGPYVAKNGKKMRKGAATLVVKGNEHWPGVGHQAVYEFNGKDYIIFHGYDATDDGNPKLWIKRLQWTEDGWPEVSLEE